MVSSVLIGTQGRTRLRPPTALDTFFETKSIEREREVRQTDRQTDRQRQTDRHTETDRGRQTEKDRCRDRDRDRDRDRARQTDRQKDRGVGR